MSPSTPNRPASSSRGAETVLLFREEPAGGGLFVARGSAQAPGERTLVLLCEASAYDLERHCRFVRHTDPGAPYDFPHMEFFPDPPGLRVGPWPGWRGIPPMPELTLRVGGASIPGRCDFWGDEFACQRLRYVFGFEAAGGELLEISSADKNIIPSEGRLYPGSPFPPIAKAVPQSSEWRLGHPRLLFDAARIDELRARAAAGHRTDWETILSLLANRDLPPVLTGTSKLPDDTERLFPEDRVVLAAFVALVEPRPEHLSRAKRTLDAFLDLTGNPSYEPLQIDTQSGETLFTLCLAYDWLHALLDAGTRGRLEARIADVVDICARYLEPERRDYAQAHFLGCGLGLLAYAFLFHERDPRAREWIGRFSAIIEQLVSLLPADGFHPHGINLWIYEHGFLLRWLELFRNCAGLDFWNRTGYWRNASGFRAASTSPDLLSGIAFGDPQFRVGGDAWCHDLIAARTGSGEARRLADLLRDLPVGGVDYRHIPPRRRVYEFLYRDPAPAPQLSSDALRIFPDGGQAYYRWQDGDDECLFTIRSGFPLGRSRYDAGIRGGYGHSDPMNGAFLLVRGGDFLAAGPGPLYRRDTALFNTFTIGGAGQIGDGAVWLPDYIPAQHVPGQATALERSGMAFFHAETSAAYLPHLGVAASRREICIAPADCIIGVDRIVLRAAGSIEWRWHSRCGIAEIAAGEVSADFRIDARRPCRLMVVADGPVFRSIVDPGFVPAYPHDGSRLRSVEIVRLSDSALFIWCLLFDLAETIEVTGEADGSYALRTSRGTRLKYAHDLGLREEH